QVGVHQQVRRHVHFVKLDNLTAAVGAGIGGLADIAVVENRDNSVGVNIGVVLMGKPGIGVVGEKLEIPIQAQAPDDVAGAVAVPVIDLEQPILVAGRVEYIAVRSQLNRIPVGPVIGLR